VIHLLVDVNLVLVCFDSQRVCYHVTHLRRCMLIIHSILFTFRMYVVLYVTAELHPDCALSGYVLSFDSCHSST
jgi:hypothetical protein